MITAEQLEARKKYIGSSDAAAVLGLDPYRTAYEVWLDKTGRLEPLPENEAMRAGSALERVVLDMAEREVGTIERDPPSKTLDRLMSHADGIIVASGGPIEAKTHGITGPTRGDRFGDDESGEVPIEHAIQCTVHMLCHGVERMPLAALIGGRGFVMFYLGLDRELADTLQEQVGKFWRMVETDTPPEREEPIGEETIRRVKRTPGSVSPLMVPAELFTTWDTSRDMRLKWEKAEEAAQAEILTRLVDCEAITVDGGPTLTYFERERRIKAQEAYVQKYRQLKVEKIK